MVVVMAAPTPTTQTPLGDRTTRPWVPWVGLAVTVLLMATAMAVPRVLGVDVKARSDLPERAIPPLHGLWDPKLWGPGTLPAVLLAVVAFGWARGVAERLPWRWLLVATYVAGVAWLMSLALVDGASGITRTPEHGYDYLETAKEIDDVGLFLDGFIERIPGDHPDNWPVHVAGHPPLATLFFVALVRLGLGDSFVVGTIITLIAAATALPVLSTVRRLGSEEMARRAAPFLVFTPAAIFMAVSGDAVFAAVAACGLAALAVAATTEARGRSVAWSVLAGLLLGCCVLLSYGLTLLGFLALVVLHLGRSWRPLPIAVAAALVPVLVLAVAGFAWWEAYPVLHDRYWWGMARERPFWYWSWGNLGALAFSAGPLLGAGIALAVARGRELRRTVGDLGSRAVLWLVAGAAAAVVSADLSRMSKAEVERIWLPFIPWLLLSTALLPQRWRRWGLGLQLAVAVLMQQLFYTSW